MNTVRPFLILFFSSICILSVRPVALLAQNGPADTTAAVVDTAAIDTVVVDTVSAGSGSTPSDTPGQKPEEIVSQLQNLISLSVIFLIILILAITYFLNKFLIQVVDNLSEKATSYRMAIKRSVPIIRLFIWSFSLYIIIGGIIDPPVETVITLTASIGIAVGLASQDILKNIFGGFIIILDRPFQVGDKISVGDFYGEVLQIGLRSTRIVTPDDSVISLPNGDISSKAISNANTGALDCQVVAEIYLPARIDIDQAKRIAYKAAISSRYAYLKKPVVVIAQNEIHERNFVLKLRVKAYVLDIRYEFPFQSEMTERILDEINQKKMLPETSA
ncbi:mechanosensitive ion channel family protein [Halalkalibaculum sp. DA3122]|uniref:mechanosensitive ion channel family protein n=1 Tax=Halalkalibaculum sp. DA3122 TaxID=3373607 RepID=UPI003755018B